MSYKYYIVTSKLHSHKFFIFYFFIYNQIPPQSEENNILHKRTEIKY